MITPLPTSEMLNPGEMAGIALLRELLEMARDNDAASKRLLALEKAQQDAVEDHAAAQQMVRELDAKDAELRAKAAELEGFERRLNDVNQALTAEKRKWEAMRQAADAQLRERHNDLAAWHDRLTAQQERYTRDAHRLQQLIEENEALNARVKARWQRLQDTIHEVAGA